MWYKSDMRDAKTAGNPDSNSVPEDFNGIVEYLTREEFLRRVREERPDLSDANIARGTAYQYTNKAGKATILICTDRIPPEYVRYVLTHEVWEHYVANKTGYNLVDAARRNVHEYLDDIRTGMATTQKDAIFNHFVDEYKFDYKHEFAIWKEYSLAEEEGNLDQYHRFIMQLRQEDLVNYGHHPIATRKTQNDMSIRESVFNKIKKKTPHHFKKNLS